MTQKKNKKRIIFWNTLNLLIIILISIVLLNNGTSNARILYTLASSLFLFSGIFLKKTYTFLGIMIFILAFVFILKDSAFNLDFFINSNK